MRAYRNALAWGVRLRLPRSSVAAARRALALIDRLTLPVSRLRLRERRPIPPRPLRARVGAVSPRLFLAGGAASAREITAALSQEDIDHRRDIRLLDFGCGCGRVARHLAPALRAAEYHGCDVDAAAISWLRENLPEGRFAVSDFRPPLPYAEGSFNVVFSLSIFTHLDADVQLALLRELRRVLMPGGVALLSIHGPTAAGRVWWGQGLSREAADEINRRAADLEREGFFFVPFEDLSSDDKFAGVAGPYGNSFQTHDWTRASWGRILQIERVLPAAAGYQDFVLARNAE